MDNFGIHPIEGKTICLILNKNAGYVPDQLNLVGKVLSDKEVKFKICKNTLLGLWDNPTGVAITEAGRNKMLISFKDINYGLKILRNGLWNIRDSLINLQYWSQDVSIYEVSHEYMEFWIQVHRVPVDYMRVETTRAIGNMMGILAEVENPIVDSVLMREFLKFEEARDVTKPLQTGFWIKRGERLKA
ncbi:hypothetical protein AHAS_Ahas11G0109000 [Arachis hypogaea]